MDQRELGVVGGGMTSDQRKSFSHKTRVLLDHVFGEIPDKKNKASRRAIPVRINGKIYGSMALAARSLNISFNKVSNRVRSRDSKWIHWEALNKPTKHTN